MFAGPFEHARDFSHVAVFAQAPTKDPDKAIFILGRLEGRGQGQAISQRKQLFHSCGHGAADNDT